MPWPETYRVLDANGNLITGGVTAANAVLTDVIDAIQRLKADATATRMRTDSGWFVERE